VVSTYWGLWRFDDDDDDDGDFSDEVAVGSSFSFSVFISFDRIAPIEMTRRREYDV